MRLVVILAVVVGEVEGGFARLIENGSCLVESALGHGLFEARPAVMTHVGVAQEGIALGLAVHVAFIEGLLALVVVVHQRVVQILVVQLLHDREVPTGGVRR